MKPVKSFLSLITLSLFLCIIWYPVSVHAVSNTIPEDGKIVEDTVISGNQVIDLTCDVQIRQDASLTISDGVTVNGGDHTIKNYGKLMLDGCKLSNITLDTDDISGDAYSIVVISNCEIIDSYLSFSDSEISITNSIFRNVSNRNDYDYIYIWYPINETLISNNLFDHCGGLSVGSQYDVIIRGNTFHACKFAIKNWAQYSSQCHVNGNTILGKGEQIRLEYDSGKMEATGNYWGTTDPSIIESMILDANDDFSLSGPIDYSGYLSESPTTHIVEHEYKLVKDKCIAPTCESEGLNYYECDCGDIKTEVVPKITQYQVVLTSQPSQGGTCEGAGMYELGTSATVKASAYNGYRFNSWWSNGVQVSTDETYTFSSEKNIELTARFDTVYPVSTSVYPLQGGTVTGEGEYLYGEYVTVTAVPAVGYEFEYWIKNSDGYPITDSMTSFYVYDATKIRAFFRKVETPSVVSDYTVSVTASPAAGGTFTGAGTFGAGEIVTVSAEPDEGYIFVGWSINGTPVAATPTYSFALNANTALTAVFEEKPAAPVDYQVIVENGTSSAQFAREGSTITIKADGAPAGKLFEKWTVVSGGVQLDDAAKETTTFVMGAQQVKVSAVYADIPEEEEQADNKDNNDKADSTDDTATKELEDNQENTEKDNKDSAEGVDPADNKESDTNDNTGTLQFTDVQDASKFFFNPVYWAVEKGITSGKSQTTFAPADTCTRAQIVTFLYRAAGQPDVENSNTFMDVPANAYYAKAVSWAVENGITSGTTPVTFSPNDPCTRAQAVTFMYRAAKEPDVNINGKFTDVPADKYYAKSVSWASENGITSGTSATTFSPNESCTRGQIVTFIYRSMN